MRPFELGRLGLGRAVAGLIKASVKSSGIEFDTDVDDLDGVFGVESETHFYRIIQESVANILKHSKAKHAQVRIKRDSLQVRVWIRDDGCGFSTSDGQGFCGMGLASIAERVRILGGRLRLDTAPACGTTLEIVVPVQNPVRDAEKN
ncbi:MAG: ATP-binding protein [Verrucomicrobiota bacterium]|nr:ATP-binding protein [Verrucomicrobiota bacterium]